MQKVKIMITGISLIFALLLWPFFGPSLKHHTGWIFGIIYLACCMFLTPILGIPLYKYVLAH